LRNLITIHLSVHPFTILRIIVEKFPISTKSKNSSHIPLSTPTAPITSAFSQPSKCTTSFPSALIRRARDKVYYSTPTYLSLLYTTNPSSSSSSSSSFIFDQTRPSSLYIDCSLRFLTRLYSGKIGEYQNSIPTRPSNLLLSSRLFHLHSNVSHSCLPASLTPQCVFKCKSPAETSDLTGRKKKPHQPSSKLSKKWLPILSTTNSTTPLSTPNLAPDTQGIPPPSKMRKLCS